MLLRTVSLYRFFQLFESCGRMLRIDLCAQCRDLMLQIMRKTAQRFDIFLGLQILLMLAFQLRVD